MQNKIKLANTIIEKAKWVKFLGIIIYEQLKWDEHINLVNKTNIKITFRHQ